MHQHHMGVSIGHSFKHLLLTISYTMGGHHCCLLYRDLTIAQLRSYTSMDMSRCFKYVIKKSNSLQLKFSQSIDHMNTTSFLRYVCCLVGQSFAVVV